MLIGDPVSGGTTYSTLAFKRGEQKVKNAEETVSRPSGGMADATDLKSVGG